MIEQGKMDDDLSSAIDRMWNNLFQADLTTADIEELLAHYRRMYGARRTRKARRKGKQVGGMAPLNYTMGQGITGTEFGRFPESISAPQPLAALDRFFESPIGRDCNATGGFPAPTQTGGANEMSNAGDVGTTGSEGDAAFVSEEPVSNSQTGGSFFDALFTPHMPASIPHNIAEMSLSAIQGAPITNPPSSPVTATVPLMSPAIPQYNAKDIQPISSLAPIAVFK